MKNLEEDKESPNKNTNKENQPNQILSPILKSQTKTIIETTPEINSKLYRERTLSPDLPKETINNMLQKMEMNNKKVYDVEYGIYHFRIPTPLLRKASFDCSGEPTFWAKSISHEYTIFYKPIPPPGPNDWLMSHKEYGQTFNEYKNFGFHEIQAIKGKTGNKNLIKKEVIYIAPLNYNINPSFDENFITSIIVFCQSYFHDMQFRKLNIEINHKNVEYRKYEDGSYQINACTLIEKMMFILCLQ